MVLLKGLKRQFCSSIFYWTFLNGIVCNLLTMLNVTDFGNWGIAKFNFCTLVTQIIYFVSQTTNCHPTTYQITLDIVASVKDFTDLRSFDDLVQQLPTVQGNHSRVDCVLNELKNNKKSLWTLSGYWGFVWVVSLWYCRRDQSKWFYLLVVHQFVAREGGDSLEEKVSGFAKVAHGHRVEAFVNLQPIPAVPIATLLHHGVSTLKVRLNELCKITIINYSYGPWEKWSLIW